MRSFRRWLPAIALLAGCGERPSLSGPSSASPLAAPSALELTSPGTGAALLAGPLPFPPDFNTSVSENKARSVKDYGAKGDGVTDDTAAIQRALNDGRRDAAGNPLHPSNQDWNGRTKRLFFPKGTYLVSQTLDWVGCCATLFGQGSGSTIIKLKNGSTGFADPTLPKPVILTPTGNMSFKQYILDMAIDTGTGNPGAVGISYISSNAGSLRNVVVRSGDGAGVIGVDMTRKWPGPLLLKNVKVSGFNYGIKVHHGEYGPVLENITVEKQRVAGVYNETNTLAIRNLRSTNAKPAVISSGVGVVVLLDSLLQGGAGGAAIDVVSNGNLYARRVNTAGYANAVRYKGTAVAGTAIAEYVSMSAKRLFAGGPAGSLNLPVEETPDFLDTNTSNWAGFRQSAYGNNGNLDVALKSGKATVYFVPDTYMQYAERSFNVPAHVRRIVGYSSNINSGPGGGIRLVVAENSANPLIIEGFSGGLKIDHQSARTVVIKNGMFRYFNRAGSGNLFLEDVCMGPFTFYSSQKVWARQFNNEAPPPAKIVNDGATLWVLGIKTERSGIVVDARPGSKTELLGAHLYPPNTFTAEEKLSPAFEVKDALFSMTGALASWSFANSYDMFVRETRGGTTNVLKTVDLRNYQRVPLFVSGQ